jgi:hypothetical protein
MPKLRQLSERPFFWPSVVCFLLLLSYFQVLSSHYVVNPDGQYILERLADRQGKYLSDLLSFLTIDFQPVRDLTFYLDLKFYQYLGWNTFIWQNIFWWFGSALVLRQVLRKIFKEIADNRLWVIVCAFSVYPLFGQVLPWGIARKHILSFFFILLATNELLLYECSLKRSHVIKLYLFYVLSVLSQPISIGWPVWAFLYCWSKKIAGSLKWLSLLGVLQIVLMAINYWYYTTSIAFAFYYPAKASDPFNIADKLLALGHHAFQIVLPYLPAFQYQLGHWSSLVGLGLLVIIGMFIYKATYLRKYLHWLIFILLPLGVVMTDSHMLFDTYLLIPAAGSWILLTAVLTRHPKSHYILFVLILFWIPFTEVTSSSWTDEISMQAQGFHNRPSCLSAITYLKSSFELQAPTPEDAKKYVYENRCQLASNVMITLHTYMLYYESDIPFDERVKNLRVLGQDDFFAQAALSALLVKAKRLQEANVEIQKLVNRWRNSRFKHEYSHIIAEVLYPYCEANRNEECTKLLSAHITKPKDIYYR